MATSDILLIPKSVFELEDGDWDPTLCPDPVTCAANCHMEGNSEEQYKKTYGIKTLDDGLRHPESIKKGDGMVFLPKKLIDGLWGIPCSNHKSVFPVVGLQLESAYPPLSN